MSRWLSGPGLARAGALVGVILVIAVAAALLGRATPTSAMGAPHFVEEAAGAGIDHVYGGEFTFAIGGGVAVFDCDGDGRPELYLAGGSNSAALYRNESPVGGALHFSRIHDSAVDLGDVFGAYPLDVDGDGEVDLAVLRGGENVILRGLGGCRFERANEAWTFDGGHAMTTAFSAAWEGSARLPTIALGNFRVLDPAAEPTRDCPDNQLFRPDATGMGYGTPRTLSPGYCAQSMLFSDWDRSGRRDLRVSNDRHYYDYVNGQEQLWRVATGEDPRLYTDADGWLQLQIEGMGIGSYDLTSDGFPEFYLTSQGTNRLQTLTTGPETPTYRDVGLQHGVTAFGPFTGGDTRPSTAWHPEFQDVNNDGFIDLFVSKGNVDAQPDYAERDPSNLFLGQPDGTFVEGAEAAGIVTFLRGRGAALTDFNLDGMLDLVEVNFKDRVLLFRNVGAGDATQPMPMGHWLALRLVQPGPNRDAIGAWTEVKIGDLLLRRELTVGGGHVGGQLGWIHFGLGPAADAEVRVQWPDGETGPWIGVRADQFVVLRRGANSAEPWLPGGS
ncbi:MAG: CRTAC1 family protein [Chloroflexota bacterium]|nr:CRTAC1 family protein [Chloroflexota bacterium]